MKDLDLRVWAVEMPFDDVVGPRAGYHPNEAAVVREKVLRRVGEAPVAILGAGDKGVVYGLPSGKVLKITRDASEVEALSLMKGAQDPNLVQVFDAFFAVDDPGSPRLMGAGAIVREAVDATVLKVPAVWELRDLFWQAAARGSRMASESGDLCKGMDTYAARLRAELPELNHFQRTFVKAVESGVKALKGLGICTFDLGPGNIGLIEQRPVLYDVGVATVKGATPEVI